MCSWCWGFVPVLDALEERFCDIAPLSVVMGGLRPGQTQPLDEPTKGMIRGHWEHVHEASGQPFDFNFFERDGFVYDTEPSCRAVVAARLGKPGDGRRMLKRLHRAFYAENRDITDESVLIDVACDTLGASPESFRCAMDDPKVHMETKRDFLFAKELGVSGFPALLARKGDEIAFVTMGWRPYADLEAPLARWLAKPAEPLQDAP